MATAFRLPPEVRPRRYEATIRADPHQPTFAGRVRIHLDLDETVDHIRLHAKGLGFDAVVLETGTRSLKGDPVLEPHQETVDLRFEEMAEPGEAVLDITYTGEVGHAMAGLYLSKDGDDVALATQCEATDARRILPCFDEPTYKARFRWTIEAPDDCIALANGPLETEEALENGYRRHTFAPTRPMSSYLAALAIGPFQGTPPVEVDGVPHRVYAIGDRVRYGAHGRDFGAALHQWYHTYFDHPYPFGKYDQVAVPSFSFGAMENVGLVIFRASLLLLDPEHASWRERKNVDLVIAHEFAHMWFGNLVTMNWWDDLWLNEAFAEWIAHKSVDELEPELEIWHPFAARSAGALAIDALETTHAIYNEIETPEQALEMFDQITYGKGSAVMRMLEAFLGPDVFGAGLRTYMQAFAESNAAGADLWNHLEKAANRPVSRIMEGWVERPGHPEVHIEVDGSDLVVRQQRARAGDTGKGARDDDALWDVPLVVRFRDDEGDHEHRHLLSSREERVNLVATGTVRWAYGNADDVGFYRVDHGPQLLDALQAAYAELRPAERRALVRDQWALVRTGRRGIERYLDLLDEALAAEDHYAVTESLVGRVRELERMIEHADDPAALAGFRTWVAQRFGPAWDALGAEVDPKDDPQTRERRGTVLRAVAGIARDGSAADIAARLAARERQDAHQVDPDLAGAAVAVAAALGDEDHFAAHAATYQSRRDEGATPQEVERYLYTLAAFRDPVLVDRVLAMLADGTIANQAVGAILRIMLGEPHAQRAAWAHITKDWAGLRADIGEPWVVILTEAAGALPPDMQDEVIRFFDAHLDGAAQQAFSRTKERLAIRAALYGRVLEPLTARFR